MKKRVSQKEKNFLPSLIVTLSLWTILILIILFVDPGKNAAILTFFSTIFLALLFTLSLILGNTKRGLLISLTTIVFLTMRFFHIGNLLNLILLFGIALTIDIYLFQRN